MKNAILVMILALGSVTHAADSSEILFCKPQELVTKSTKTGFSTRLAAKSDSEVIAYVKGSRVTKDEAVRFAVSNLKPIQK